MGVCELNWSNIKDILVALIGAGIPSAVAIIIFTKWRKQKASEVVANEARQFIVKLAKLQSLQSEIHKIIYESNGYNGANEEIDNFKETHKLLNDSAVMLGESLKDTAISHYSTTVMAQAKLFEKDIEDYKNDKKSLNQVRMIDPDDAKEISDIFLDYALYKDPKKII
ncbi:hypothetical protein [Acinetobacter bereziniae]|uniref:hypothetical protein n=1 Tax=Acinetobacter bereziniae TaxID=106648 RepID=UPI0030090DA1